MNVDFKTAVKLFFANYSNFKGRSTRAEYWWVALFLMIVSIAISFVCSILGFGETGTQVVSGLWSLAVLVPNLALTWRRLHDVDKAGGWIFICLIPVIGIIWLIVLLATPSKPDNRFGLNPYGDEQAA